MIGAHRDKNGEGAHPGIPVTAKVTRVASDDVVREQLL